MEGTPQKRAGGEVTGTGTGTLREDQSLLDELGECSRQIKCLETRFLEINRYGKLLSGSEGGTSRTANAGAVAAEGREAESVHESVHSPAPAEGGSVVVGSGNDGALQGYSQRIFSDASCRWWEDPAVLGR